MDALSPEEDHRVAAPVEARSVGTGGLRPVVLISTAAATKGPELEDM